MSRCGYSYSQASYDILSGADALTAITTISNTFVRAHGKACYTRLSIDWTHSLSILHQQRDL
jgi:hypothetical protein